MNKILKSLLRKKRRKESWFKYSMSVLHLWLGLLSSVVIFIVCITGSIYTFKNKIIDFYNYDKVYVSAENKPFLALDSIQAIFKEKELNISHVNLPYQANKSIIVSYESFDSLKAGSYYVNPYSGKILGSGDYSLNNFFSIILSLHRSLLIKNIGRDIVGVSILIFAFMLLSGFVLWLPKKWKQLKNVLNVKWKAKFKKINNDIHVVFGFYFLIPLIFISITGLYVSYPWVKSGLIVAMGGNPVLTANADEDTTKELSDNFARLLAEMLEKENEKESMKGEPEISLDSILNLANKELNYKAITSISLPNSEEPRYVVKKINRENWLRALLPDVISFDKKGNLKSVDLFKNKPLHKQFVEISLPLHTGEIMGWPSLIFYFIATIIGWLLPVTGFIIWWKKNL
ncbi:MAG: PepSY domain-containing protein [Labilibaculum sp.]|nr:PepSY domain-containing protein [Labilibaculum sp.]